MELSGYQVTEEFVAAYEALDAQTAVVVDDAIARLLVDHLGAWARQGRVAGEHGEAWIVEIRTRTADVSLYWDYLNEQLALLIVLLVRPG